MKTDIIAFFNFLQWFVQDQNTWKLLGTSDRFLCNVFTLCHIVMFTDHSGHVVLGMNCLCPLEHWGCGFKSHLRHGCLSTFILCLCCPVQVVALQRADPPSKESYRLSTRLRSWSETKRFTAAPELWMNEWMNDDVSIDIYYHKNIPISAHIVTVWFCENSAFQQ
jgi:hypothetical protein